MKSISKVVLIHPFTPQAAGVVEESVSTYHSQPHLKVLERFVERHDAVGCMGYFTPKRRGYGYKFGKVQYQFWPVDYSFRGDHKKWKKQWSKQCLKAFEMKVPDVTIINMSGHSSRFSHQLANIILGQGKRYIAMLGGQHYSDTPSNRTYYQNAHHILVHTELQKESMQSMELFRGADIRVFPLGVDTEVFRPETKKLKDLFPKLLYVGRIVDWKRVHLAIEALSGLVRAGYDTARLDIIGPVFSQPYYEQLLKQVENLKLDRHVYFLGHKEHHELPAYFQEADLFLLPSDKETFGMVMIEAMACGTPIVAMDCPGGPKDVVAHGVDGLLARPETYAQTVLAYFQNGIQRKPIEEAARAKVVAHYSLEATYKVLKQSVIEAMKGSDGGI